jgi:hypothetical protein
VVSPSGPAGAVGCGDQSDGLGFGEEAHDLAVVAFGWDGSVGVRVSCMRMMTIPDSAGRAATPSIAASMKARTARTPAREGADGEAPVWPRRSGSTPLLPYV